MRATLTFKGRRARGPARSPSSLLPYAAALAAALALAAASPLAAQEAGGFDEAALFEGAAFETAVAESAAPGGAAAPEFLAGGTIVVRAAASGPVSMDGYSASSSAQARLFAKASLPDYGAFYAAFNVRQDFLAAGSGGLAPSPAPDLAEPSVTLSELHWSFDLGKVLFLRLGDQLVAWGPSRIWTPVDFVNREKADAFSSVDLRAGKPGLRLHLPLPSANAFFFADFSGSVEGGAAQDLGESLAYAARLDATLAEAEFGLSGWAGARVQDKLGFDFSGRLFGASVYGEAAWAPAYDSGEASLAASLGFSRALGDLKRWTLGAEFFYNSAGADRTGQYVAPPPDWYAPLYLGEYYGYASLQAKELFSPSLATSLSVLANLSELSYTVKASESFDFPRSLPFTLSLSYSGGGAGKEFTWASGDDSLALSFEVRAEF